MTEERKKEILDQLGIIRLTWQVCAAEKALTKKGIELLDALFDRYNALQKELEN